MGQFDRNKTKGQISKRALQENKAHQIFRKTNISYALIHIHMCVYKGVRNVHFSENLLCFVFLETPVLCTEFTGNRRGKRVLAGSSINFRVKMLTPCLLLFSFCSNLYLVFKKQYRFYTSTVPLWPRFALKSTGFDSLLQ